MQSRMVPGAVRRRCRTRPLRAHCHGVTGKPPFIADMTLKIDSREGMSRPCALQQRSAWLFARQAPGLSDSSERDARGARSVSAAGGRMPEGQCRAPGALLFRWGPSASRRQQTRAGWRATRRLWHSICTLYTSAPPPAAQH